MQQLLSVAILGAAFCSFVVRSGDRKEKLSDMGGLEGENAGVSWKPTDLAGARLSPGRNAVDVEEFDKALDAFFELILQQLLAGEEAWLGSANTSAGVFRSGCGGISKARTCSSCHLRKS